MKYPLTDVETVREEGSWLFTVHDGSDEREVVLVPCDDATAEPVQAWVNQCTHESQRLYRDDSGIITRNGSIVCPKHGSAFDSCSGDCENGPAAETTLRSVEITVEHGEIYLTDDDVRFSHEGPAENDDDDPPDTTTHLRF